PGPATSIPGLWSRVPRHCSPRMGLFCSTMREIPKRLGWRNWETGSIQGDRHSLTPNGPGNCWTAPTSHSSSPNCPLKSPDRIRRGPPFWKVWYCSGDNGYSSTVRPIPWSPWYGQTSELSPVEVHLVHIFPYRMGQHRPDVLSLSMGLSDESGGDFHNRGGHPSIFGWPLKSGGSSPWDTRG